MEQKEGLICARSETPSTCILCESEGQDYCMICADAYTYEEYEERIQAINVLYDEEYTSPLTIGEL